MPVKFWKELTALSKFSGTDARMELQIMTVFAIILTSTGRILPKKAPVYK